MGVWRAIMLKRTHRFRPENVCTYTAVDLSKKKCTYFYVPVAVLLQSLGYSISHYLQRWYDMNGRSQMRGGKTGFILPKKISANRFSWDSTGWKNLERPLLSLYGTEWREHGNGLWNERLTKGHSEHVPYKAKSKFYQPSLRLKWTSPPPSFPRYEKWISADFVSFKDNLFCRRGVVGLPRGN